MTATESKPPRKPPSARAAMALAKSQAYQDAADAPATLKAYAADLASYQAWCDKNGLTAMPATPQVVGAYLAAAGEGYAGPTLRRRVAAIARACGVAGAPLDTKHPAIRETLRGIARTHGSPARRAAALTTAEIRKLSRACDADLAGARDRALLLVGFAGALRRSELVGLDVAHIAWTDEGLKLSIVRSKTDKQGEGTEIGLAAGRHEENQRWSLDFVADQFTDGHRFRILAVYDDCTRECLALVADTSMSARRVARELDAIIAWRWDFNQVRPHSSLGYRTPADHARVLSGETGRRAANPDHFARRLLASG